MSSSSWLASLRARVLGSPKSGSRQKRSHESDVRCRPSFEALESRLVPNANFSFANGVFITNDALPSVKLSVSTPSTGMLQITISGDTFSQPAAPVSGVTENSTDTILTVWSPQSFMLETTGTISVGKGWVSSKSLSVNGQKDMLYWSSSSGAVDVANASLGYATLVSDAQGNVFGLNPANETIYEHTQGSKAGFSSLAPGNSLVGDSTGNVFVLNADTGLVYEHNLGAASSWTQIGGGTSMVGDADGNVYVLNAGNENVYEHTPGSTSGWTIIGNGTSMVEDSTGNMYVLNATTGYVYEHTLGAGSSWAQIGSTGIFSNVANNDFPINGAEGNMVSDATGNVFVLNSGNGNVYEHNLGSTWSWTPIGAGNSMVSDAVGNVFVLNDINTNVYEHTLGSSISNPVWTVVGNGTSMVGDATGNLFVLNANNTDVYEHTLASSISNPGWTVVGNGTNMVGDATGNVFVLNANNDQVYEHTLGSSNGWTDLAPGGAMAGDAAGNVFVLNTQTDVLYEHVLGTQFSWIPLTLGNIQSFEVNEETGQVYALTTNEVLYQYGGSPYAWSQISSSYVAVEQYDIAGNGDVVWRDANLNVWDHVPTNTYSTWIGSGIASLSIDGSNGDPLMLCTQGLLYDVTNPSAGVASCEPRATSPYSLASGTLFNPNTNEPSYTDVQQGGLGDCWLLAGLAEVAARDPSAITSMFTYDGTMYENDVSVQLYKVRYYNSAGTPEYVVVDTELPAGGYAYDAPVNGVLWVALAEKAYAEFNALDEVTTNNDGADSYTAIAGGTPAWSLQAITGNSTSTPAFGSNLATDWTNGQLINMCTPGAASAFSLNGAYVATSHCYAVIGYDASTKVFTLFNPWGVNGGYDGTTFCAGTVSGTWQQLAKVYSLAVTGTGAAPQAVDPDGLLGLDVNLGGGSLLDAIPVSQRAESSPKSEVEQQSSIPPTDARPTSRTDAGAATERLILQQHSVVPDDLLESESQPIWLGI